MDNGKDHIENNSNSYASSSTRPQRDGRDTVTTNGWTEDRCLMTAGFVAT
jgi:hypothetical protein